MATHILGRTPSTSRVPVQEKAAPGVQVNAPSRREFLYYIWGASIALLVGEAGAGLIWFALPRFKEGTFGGVFEFPPDKVPDVNKTPYHEQDGHFWVSYPTDGFIVLYDVCPHLGCLPNWSESNFRFECPCHGSKYQLDGKYIEGPAPRSMDRMFTTLTFEDGSTMSMDSSGDPMDISKRGKIASISIDTGKVIQRNGRV
ncbi:MAG TPA: Rieske 2Fe-2S domain-containing protein [Phototrophicaceae bacterium]|nr:Rieske 2Fe-2S domain-containing protein [Phototrophicaceae bacterium]